MRKMSKLALAAALVLLAAPLLAGDAEPVTVEGTLLCAKCTLGEDREKCQNAISVESEEEGTTIYYLAENKTSEAAGHVCEESREVRATGTVSETDGQTWLTASEIENLEADVPAEDATAIEDVAAEEPAEAHAHH